MIVIESLAWLRVVMVNLLLVIAATTSSCASNIPCPCRSQNAIGDDVPANCKDEDLHKYLKNGIALNKVVVPKAGAKIHDSVKFKYHALDNLKVMMRILKSVMKTISGCRALRGGQSLHVML